MINFKQYANEDGLPIIDNITFDKLTEQYGREEFRQQLADYLEEVRPPFPLKEISYERMREIFLKLKNTDVWKYITPNESLDREVIEKSVSLFASLNSSIEDFTSSFLFHNKHVTFIMYLFSSITTCE